MIEKTIENWHRHIRGEFPGGLDALLAEDVVFYSPVVYTPPMWGPVMLVIRWLPRFVMRRIGF